MANEETKLPEYEIRRPGVRSSEFWLSIGALILSTVVPVVLPALVDEVGRIVAASPFAALAPSIVAAGYAISRGLVKKSRNDASALATKAPENVNVASADNAPAAKAPEAAAPQAEPEKLSFADSITDTALDYVGDEVDEEIDELLEKIKRKVRK